MLSCRDITERPANISTASSVVRLGGDLTEERYLDFICASRGNSPRYPVPVFTTLDHERAPVSR